MIILFTKYSEDIPNLGTIDILILYDVCLINITKELLVNKYKELNFVDHYFVENGPCTVVHNRHDYLVIFSKKKLENASSCNISNFLFRRNCIVFTYENINIIAVKLDPGINKSIANNILLSQVKLILEKHKKLDILIGNFYFTKSNNIVNTLDKFELVADNNTNLVFASKKAKVLENKYLI